jgi:hypothetical protein
MTHRDTLSQEFGRKQSWPDFKVLSQLFPGVTEENHETSKDSRSPGPDLNPGNPEYEAGVSTTSSRHSASFCLS